MDVAFSEQEQIVRKRWLQLLIVIVLLHVSRQAWVFFHLDLVTLDLFLFFNYALFHCAYKKRGTKLLTLSLVLSSLSLIFLSIQTLGTLVSFATNKAIEFSLFYHAPSLLERALIAGSCALAPIFYLFSFRLRRINKLRRFAK